jgi:hypothetical protein
MGQPFSEAFKLQENEPENHGGGLLLWATVLKRVRKVNKSGLDSGICQRQDALGEILDAEKMKKCVWVRPKLVAAIAFLEWTEGDRLRHSKFVALRDDKNAREGLKKQGLPFQRHLVQPS